MSKKNPDMELSMLSRLWRENVSAKAAMREEVERLLNERLAEQRQAVAEWAYKAHRAGASKSRIGRIMGTTDWKTINERIDWGKRLVESFDGPVEEIWFGKIYRWSDSDVIFTVDNGDGTESDQDTGREIMHFDGYVFNAKKNWDDTFQFFQNSYSIGSYPKPIVEYAESIVQDVLNGDYGTGD